MIEITDLLPNGIAQVRETLPNGTFSRVIKLPGDDLSDMPDESREQIKAHWTPEIVAAWAGIMAQGDI